MKTRLIPSLLVALALSAVAVSCTFNIFDPIDSPDGDAQLISAARAALDRGDFEEAVEYYQKLSGDNADIKASEQAFALLAKHNLAMGSFANAFGLSGGGTGKSITILANAIGAGAGEAARLDIAHAFQKVKEINSAPLKGLVRFLGSISLIAEMLAEGAASKGSLQTSDIALNATACLAADTTVPASCGVLLAAECGRPTGSLLLSGTGNTDPNAGGLNLETATDAELTSATNAPTLTLIQIAISHVQAGLTAIGSGGGISGGASGFAGAFGSSLAFTGDAPCYRAVLLDQGIGTY